MTANTSAADRTPVQRAARAVHVAIRRIVGNAQARVLNGFQVHGQLADGQLVTIGDILDDLGANAAWRKRFAAQTGIHVANAYRELHNTDPREIYLVERANGHRIKVKVYAQGEPAIAAGLNAYNRTAQLIAASAAK